MATALIQARLPMGLIEKIDHLVETGLYSSKSDVIKDAVRKLVLQQMVAILPNSGDSVKEVRKIRKSLSKNIKSFKDIKKLNNSY